jgi:hypothetical protein
MKSTIGLNAANVRPLTADEIEVIAGGAVQLPTNSNHTIPVGTPVLINHLVYGGQK